MKKTALYCALLGAKLFANTWNVPPGGNLQETINAAVDGDLISLQAGTYTTTEAFFYVRKALTVIGAGTGSTVIQAPNNAGFGIQVTASNVRIEGLRITPAQFGIVAGQAGQTLSNVVLRDILIDNATTAHGVLFFRVTNGFIQRCRVASAYANGIMIDDGSVENMVSNNTIQSTQTQHAIAIKNSDRNTVVNNIVSGSGFHGIILVGSQYNRIHNNNISGQAYDGITLTWNGDENQRLSVGNYVGQNTIAGNVVRTDGTGIWMTYGANGTYVFGNVQYGAVEAGISSFNADSNWIRGNVISSNGQAGVLVWKFDQQLKRNEYTTIHNNLVYNQQNSNGILFRGAWFNEAAWNYMSNSGTGFVFEDSAGASGESTLFENAVRDVGIGLLISASTRSTRVYRNRFINISENYIFQGAEAILDASKWLGGNYWSEHPSTQPYSRFVTRTVPFVERSGAYVDRFPYADETLASDYARSTNRVYTMQVDAPVAGTIAAAGSRKTIGWRSKGCMLVDLYYTSPAGTVGIATNYPDHGFYQWTVPAATPRTDYQIRVDCKNSAGTTQLTAFSSQFTIAAGDLVLLAPGPDVVLNGGQTTRVVWARSGAVAAVNVLYRLDTGPWTPIISNVNEDNVLIAVPNVGWPRVQFCIQASNEASLADGTDRYVVIRDGSVAIFSPQFNTNAITGETLDLEWVSPPGSTFISIDLWDSQAQVFRPVTQNLADFGRYRWLVPELYMTAGYLRWTFKNAQGATMFVLNGGTLNIRYSTAPGSRTPFYRLYSAAAREHMYTTFQAEYDYLGANGWIQERTVGDILNGPLTVGSTNAIPLYRLFDLNTAHHLWTTDRNEYFTLRALANWIPENLAGYLFPAQVAGTIPYLRLVQQFPPYAHHWTSSACEHNYLRTVGWTSEGIVGYVYANADSENTCTQQPVLSVSPPVLTSRLSPASKFSRPSQIGAESAVSSGISPANDGSATVLLPFTPDCCAIGSDTPADAGDWVALILSEVGLVNPAALGDFFTVAIETTDGPVDVLSAVAILEGAVELRFRIPPGLPSGAAQIRVRSATINSVYTAVVYVK